jgi:exosortase/archaeosortase family protein
MSTALPHAAPARLVRLPRALLAAGVLALTAFLVVAQHQVRHLEATLANTWINPLTGGDGLIWGDSFLLHLTPTQIIAFRITVECTILVLIVPILVFAAATIAFTRVSITRWFLATLAGAALLVLVNQIRLGVIAFATLTWGLDPGYEISHTFVGSALALVGFAGSVILMLTLISTKKRKRRHGRRAAH